jgi:hypothetical protein
MLKLSKSGGEEKVSEETFSAISLHFGNTAYCKPALRQVANRANPGRFGAKPADETEEIDDAREERELSVIMDSGDDASEEFDGAKDGRRLGK